MRAVAGGVYTGCLALSEIPNRLWQWLRDRSPDTRLFAIGFVLLLPLFWAPLFVTRLLPGLDLPFHLGIADMLSKAGTANSPYAPYYDGGVRVAPYAAHYIALVALGKLMNLLAAHKVVVAIYVASMPLAASSLLAACGRSRVPALLAFPLAYNLTLHYGFVSFALSLPVLMLLLAQMARYVQAESVQIVRTWIFAAALAFLLFLCHLQNFLFGVGAALAFVVFTRISWRRRLLGAAAVVPALGAFLYWQLTATTAGPSRTVQQVWDIIKRQRLSDLDGRTFIQDMGRRLAAIHNHAMRAFTDMVEVKACSWLLIVMATYFVLGLVTWKLVDKSADTSANKPRSFWLPSAVAVLAALAAFLLLPHHLPQLELMTFYPRFAVLVLLMALLLIPGHLRHLRAPWRWLLPVPALLLCALYSRELISHYRLYAAETADFLEVLDKTPPGARVLSLVFNRTSRVMRIESAYVGMSGFYPALRPHPNSMVNVWYCGMRHMPCQPKPTTVDFPKPWEPQRFNAEKNLPVFEYYFVRDLPPGFDLFKGESWKVEVFAQKGSWIVFRRRS